MHCPNPGRRKIKNHKLILSFTEDANERVLYAVWRKCVKDQMIARGFAPAGLKAPNYPDADFLPIYTGMRTLRPACGYIISAVAAHDMQHLEDIEEALVSLVKDSYRKLNNTKN